MSPKNILVVALDNLGDAVMASAVFRPLRTLYPGAQLGLWIKKYAAPLFDDQSLLDRVHASDPFWDTAPGRPKGDWSSFRKTWGEIRDCRYDLVFVLNTEWRRALACQLARIPKRVGYKRRKSQYFLTNAVKPLALSKPRVEEHRILIEKASGKSLGDDYWVPRLDTLQSDLNWVNSWLARLKWNRKKLIVIHPFSGDEEKSWPVPRWFELMRMLAVKEKNARFALVCTKEEQTALKQELSRINTDLCQVLQGTFTELRGILSQCHLFIGGDSGPAHVAAAMDKPVLSLFGPTDPHVYAPRGRATSTVIKQSPLQTLVSKDVCESALALLS